MIELVKLTRVYEGEGNRLTALDAISLTVESGEFVAVTGASGSGKSTLLGLMAGLDRPTSGHVHIDGEDITRLSEEKLSTLRGKKIGFVFQNFLLIPTLTALENVRLPAEIQGDAGAAARAPELLAMVGLAERGHHYPSQLSGGEMQRVAVARAFVNRPPLLFADEPTGNLDSVNGQRIIELLLDLNKENKSTLVLITHNPDLAGLADREVKLKDGRIAQIVKRGKGRIDMAKRNGRRVAQPARKKAARVGRK